MTSTNINPLRQSISAFQNLDIDDQLAVLALVYKSIGDTIPANVVDSLPTQEASHLVAQIQQLSQEEQLHALRDCLPAEITDQDEVMLDPHPSKALAELVQGGGTTIPTGEYGQMQTESKLAFWYALAQKLGNGVIGIPNDYQPSEQATAVLNSLKSLSTDDLVSFLKRVL
ncbi:MAG: orange carotenoid protein N-terminal domain-containing protein [Heteroscytonema crispum UTEX LB 1556]